MMHYLIFAAALLNGWIVCDDRSPEIVTLSATAARIIILDPVGEGILGDVTLTSMTSSGILRALLSCAMVSPFMFIFVYICEAV